MVENWNRLSSNVRIIIVLLLVFIFCCFAFVLFSIAVPTSDSDRGEEASTETSIPNILNEKIVEVPVTVEVEKTVLIPVTVQVTVIVTPTYTPGPSPTPTITHTPTHTPAPFNVFGCRDFVVNYNAYADNWLEILQSQIDKYDGQCVKLIYHPDAGAYLDPKSYADVFPTKDLTNRPKLNIQTDSETPSNVTAPPHYAVIWGVFQSPNTLLLRRVEIYPENQRPIWVGWADNITLESTEGLFYVGQDKDVSPGLWKSTWNPVDNSSCYWARLNPTTGAIVQNHFGIPGMTIRLYEEDVFQTVTDCGPWHYIGP